MKLFVVVSTLCTGWSVGSVVEGIFRTLEEARSCLRTVYDQTIKNFNEPENEDGFEDGDDCFDICEAEDSEIRTSCSIKEVTADI